MVNNLIQENFGIFYGVENSVVSIYFVILQEYVHISRLFFSFWQSRLHHLLKFWFQNSEIVHTDIFKQSKSFPYSWTGLLEWHLSSSTDQCNIFYHSTCGNVRWLWMCPTHGKAQRCHTLHSPKLGRQRNKQLMDCGSASNLLTATAALSSQAVSIAQGQPKLDINAS